jgi:RHS repeat-associated protein
MCIDKYLNYQMLKRTRNPREADFHPDHLGSSTFLTDANGNPYQFLLYLPFGETLAEQKSGGFSTQYRFNGKEQDQMTGLYNYGARFYDPMVSGWLSVDPLTEKYPGWSAYNYVMNNPIRLIDPTGMSSEESEICPTCPKNGEFDKAINLPDEYFYDSGSDKAFKVQELPGVEIKEKRESQGAGGKVNSFALSWAFGGGYQFEIGTVRDSKGDNEWFISHGPVLGLNLGLGFSEKAIKPKLGNEFRVKDYGGYGSGYSLGILVAGSEYSGNRNNPTYKKSDLNFKGDNYNQLGFGVFQGLDFGISWSRTKTILLNQKKK